LLHGWTGQGRVYATRQRASCAQAPQAQTWRRSPGAHRRRGELERDGSRSAHVAWGSATLDAAGRAPQAAPAVFLCARASPLKDTIGGRAVASGVAYTPWAAPGWSMRWEDEPVGSLERRPAIFEGGCAHMIPHIENARRMTYETRSNQTTQLLIS